MNSEKEENKLNRRQLLKTSTAAAAIATVSQAAWVKPVVNSVATPAHAMTSVGSIVDIASVTDILSTLVSVLTPGQIQALSGEGPLTVFAPTNQAFENISGVIAGLML